MIKIAPSLLSADFVRLEEEINNIQKAGADILHLDVMDGHFVPNLTFGLPIIKQIKDIAQIPVDVHLMVNNPDAYLETLGKWDIDYVSFHQEAEHHIFCRPRRSWSVLILRVSPAVYQAHCAAPAQSGRYRQHSSNEPHNNTPLAEEPYKLSTGSAS